MADHDIDLSKERYETYARVDAVGNVPVATAVPMMSHMPTLSTSNIMSQQALSTLRDQGFPLGLAQELGNTKAKYPIRYWIVDNSGSMRSTDGMEIRGTKDNIYMVECTRWKELQGSVEYHAELAGLIEATTIFRLLNDPGAMVGPQEFSVSENSMMGMSKSSEQDVLNAIRIVQQAEPNGVTPLTQHLNAINNRIKQIEPQLRSQGQKAVVVIATDGLPSDDTGTTNDRVQKEFEEALRRLQRLPVWVVIRLCTNDDSVTEYYNDLDKILELPLECIDDYLGEAKEIMKVNKWLNYALPLHRCREMGYQHRLFDLLDERRLNRDELAEFLKLLFGPAPFRNAPDINADWNGFYRVLENVVKAETKEWNPATRRRGPWIDMKEISKIYGDKRRGCFSFGRKRY